MTIAAHADMTWGEVLRAHVDRAGGLKATHERIVGVVGDLFGGRTSYNNLFNLEDSPRPGTKPHNRACILVLAIGGTPSDFGLDISALPPIIDQSRTSDLRISNVCWNTKLPFAPDFGIGRVA